LKFKKNGSQYSQFIFDFINKEIRFNRQSPTAELTNLEYFSQLQIAPLIIENGYLDLHLFVDNFSAELFTAGGQIVLSNQIFPDTLSNLIELTPLGSGYVFSKNLISGILKKQDLTTPPPAPPSTSSDRTADPYLFPGYPNP
jgi:sucrose-6-phosphate hydrolase SacC (GH32 family)